MNNYSITKLLKYQIQKLFEIVWDDPDSARYASYVEASLRSLSRRSAQGAKAGTPGAKFAGGHRIRVTPVPIPNTEVKPDTADGTAWETVWESRSLPALF